jgi:hypothetical protein
VVTGGVVETKSRGNLSLFPLEESFILHSFGIGIGDRYSI